MTETISPFAYNIPFFSIFLAMLAAIAAPLLVADRKSVV